MPVSSIGIEVLRKRLVDQARSSLTIKRDCVLIIPLAKHILGFDAAQLLGGPVPSRDDSTPIDNKGEIRQIIKDGGKMALRFLDRRLCPFAFG